MSENESILINPEEIEKPRRGSSNQEDKKDEKEQIKAENTQGLLKIQYSTDGRFSTPKELLWNYFTVEDVTTLSLSDQEDILENIIAILNNLKNDKECLVENMTYEEFIETLISIKVRYNTAIHTHTWICDCQNQVPDEDRQLSTTQIDLKSLKYSHITEADEEYRDIMRKEFKNMSDKEFKDYLYLRYEKKPLSDIDSWKREEEVKTIKIVEPNGIAIDGHVYMFNFSRIGDLLEGQRRAKEKYSGKIKEIQSKKYDNKKSLAETKKWKETEINKIKKQIAKYSILVARAISMIEKDGKELSIDERIQEWTKFSVEGMLRLNEFFNVINFGLNDSRELTCNLCGKTYERRLLQQELNILELLPLESNPDRDSGERTRLNIFTRI